MSEMVNIKTVLRNPILSLRIPRESASGPTGPEGSTIFMHGSCRWRMASTKQLYGRLDRWVRNLSRIEYALFVGSVSLVSQLIIDIFLTELQLLDAVITALIITIVFYLLSGIFPRD
ncbi:hypothetical protein [Halococcus thailandensis]|nr:hypothetical protein [Halococcus thailandensis]